MLKRHFIATKIAFAQPVQVPVGNNGRALSNRWNDYVSWACDFVHRIALAVSLEIRAAVSHKCLICYLEYQAQVIALLVTHKCTACSTTCIDKKYIAISYTYWQHSISMALACQRNSYLRLVSLSILPIYHGIQLINGLSLQWVITTRHRLRCECAYCLGK